MNEIVMQRLHDAVNAAVGKRLEMQGELAERDLLLAVLETICPAEVAMARGVLDGIVKKRLVNILPEVKK